MIKRIVKVILSFLFVVGMSSCASDETRIKESIEASFKYTMNDPESFEFVDFHLRDTTWYIFLDDNQKIDNKKGREAFRKFIKKENEYDEYEHVMYSAEVVIRGANSFGAKIREVYIVDVLNDKDYTVLRTMTKQEAFEEALEGLNEYYKNKNND